MKCKTLALMTILLAPMATLAEAPSTQPAKPFQGHEGRMGKRDGFMPGGKASAQEINDTLDFVKDKFPNHWSLFSGIPESAPFRNRAIQGMVMRYRQLMRMQDQNPDTYDSLLKQAQLEDDAVGFARDVKKGKPDAEVRLKEAVRRMVMQSLTERQQRIEKLKAALAEQENKLKEDQQNQDHLIAQQIDRTRNEYDRLSHGQDRDSAVPNEGQEINALQK
ncbi:MAG TPA: hypothetical protein VHS31_18690 [Tepidisphaeraceae bacterium]|jgi:hypothetical protein|nr:hypothetical protein [Tepidisphaeraceae bacterium]